MNGSRLSDQQVTEATLLKANYRKYSSDDMDTIVTGIKKLENTILVIRMV